jgi:hypothetical protein
MPNRLFSIIAESSDRMFVTEKSGKTVFFPWGTGKQGYYVKKRHFVTKVKEFNKMSSFICIFLLAIALAYFDGNVWGIVGSMVVCFGGWSLVYRLYVSRVVKSLQPAKASYAEIVFAKKEKADSEDDDSDEQGDTWFPAPLYKPVTQSTGTRFLGIKRILAWMSPGQIIIFIFLTGLAIYAIWVTIHHWK